MRQRDVMRKKQMKTRLAEIARLDVGMNKDKEQVAIKRAPLYKRELGTN